MKKVKWIFVFLLILLICFSGCVEQTVPLEEYENMENYFNNAQAQLNMLTQKHEKLQQEYDVLEQEYTRLLDNQRIPMTIIRGSDGTHVTYRFGEVEVIFNGAEATQNKLKVHFTLTNHGEEPVTLADVITLEVKQDDRMITMWASEASGSWKEVGQEESADGYFYGLPLSETPIEILIYRMIDGFYDDGDFMSKTVIEVEHVDDEELPQDGDIGDGTDTGEAQETP